MRGATATAEPVRRSSGFAPDSAYATWTKREREASDRMEAVYNHERNLEVYGPLSVSPTEPSPRSHFSKNSLRFTPRDSLHRLAKKYRREVEDIESGDLPDDAKGSRVGSVKARLHDVECEQEFRDVLAETWQASDDGTHCYTAFMGRGGLGAVVNQGATPPSFALAVLLDYTNSLRDEPTVLDWSSAPVYLRTGEV